MWRLKLILVFQRQQRLLLWMMSIEWQIVGRQEGIGFWNHRPTGAECAEENVSHGSNSFNVVRATPVAI
jgi:hypothetical protein